MKERYPPIDDVAEATSWWARFGRVAYVNRLRHVV
jgi:hypothetical protein